MADFTGKVALVTGAGSGIGKATALRLAGAGAQVVLGDVDLAAVERVAREIGDAGGSAAALAQDTAQLADHERR